MVREGVLEKFNISEIYALHNLPGLPVGHFQTTPGPIMAAVDTATITIQGRGGHGATPHETADPVVAAVSIVQAIQTILSRNHYAFNELVISVTQIHTGSADNVIPDTAWIQATVRSYDKDVQAMVIRRLEEICAGQGVSFGVEVSLDYEIGYPATINDPAKTAFACDVAREIAGDVAVNDTASAEMGAEDFAFFLEKIPGAYLFIGNGDTAGLHHPKFDFDDEAAAHGASFFARLVETAQPLE